MLSVTDLLPKTKEKQRVDRNWVAMSGSSSSVAVSPPPPPPMEHEVFLSFRGTDTRHGFTTRLYTALCDNQIQTFIDDNELGKGDEIKASLEEAIEASSIYVIVFSKNYASSPWCLDELIMILECKKKYGRDVIPIFYEVEPSEVRHHEKGSYGAAFVKHEKRYNDNLVQRWKVALTQAAGLSGWDSKNYSSEYLFVEEIAKDILEKLNRFSKSDNDYQGLVGMQKHVEQIENMLHLESTAVRIIGIWGIAGIGKTTIAAAIYDKLAGRFRHSALVLDVEKGIETYGIHHICNKCLSELGKENNTSPGPRFSYRNCKRAKVLLILDAVNNSGHLQDLIGGHGRFGQGSRIILTSTDIQVLKNAEADEIYQVKEMDSQDSLQLFSFNAFKQNRPVETYLSLSVKASNYAKGIPLALKILGLLLYDRTKEEWESELEKLEKYPEKETFKWLRVSYDGLDGEQKDIFLDIACLYRGHDMNDVKQTLDSCGFSAASGMRVLIDRGLISIVNDEIVMHDLIQNMGQEIVRQQGVDDPGKRSRLWNHEDIYRVLRMNKGTDAVKCLFLDMCQIKEVQLRAQTLNMMHNLRVLQFYNSKAKHRLDSKVSIPSFLESLPDELRLLRWDGFPQRSLPPDFCLENLVKLDMRDCQLEELWEKDQHLPNLKRLDLSGSRNLVQIPDLSQSPNIEEVILSHCKGLVQVYSSSFICKLKCIWLDGCARLRSLNIPSNILSRSSGLIVLRGCRNLEMFSVSIETMGVLLDGCSHNKSSKRFGETFKEEKKKEEANPFFEEFSFSCTFDPIDKVDMQKEEPKDNAHLLHLEKLRKGSFSLFPRLNELCWLDLSYCEFLASLPTSICKLKFLRRLYLLGCSNFEKFPEIEETMENLTVLVLDLTAIQELPCSLHHLVGLEDLSLHKCLFLEFIPPSIGSLSKLCKLNLAYCESLETLPGSIFKLKLTKLNLDGCSMLRNFPEILEPAESFADIRLTKTAINELPSLENLPGLQILQLNLCKYLEFIPNSIGDVTLLSKLDFSGCDQLSEIPSEIGRLSSLEELSLDGTGIVDLPESIVHLSSLKSLDLSDCKRLECIPQLPPFLKQLLAFDCPSIRRVSNSKFVVSSDSKGTDFKFYLTNNKKLDPSSQGNLAADAWLRIAENAYRSVFYCFPGSTVPHWFPYHSKGHSVTLDVDSLDWCNDKFIGFALCVVLGLKDINDTESKLTILCYRFIFECDGDTHVITSHDQLRYGFIWKGGTRFVVHKHTFMWKYCLDCSFISQLMSRANQFTFEIDCQYDDDGYSPILVKECGISPLFRKEKNNDTNTGDCSNFQRLSNNDIEKPSEAKLGKKAEE